MICNQWDIVVVPFPFVGSPQAKPRPVLVLSNADFHEKNNYFITAMITTAAQTQWAGDTEIKDLNKGGLRNFSVVRLKFFTLDMRVKPRKIGVLSAEDRMNFQKNFNIYIPISQK